MLMAVIGSSLERNRSWSDGGGGVTGGVLWWCMVLVVVMGW